MTSLANSLAGLSLLSGTNLGGIGSTVRVESKAVRLARAQFTTPQVTPLWSQAQPSSSAAAILRMPKLIEPATGQPSADIANAFTAYRALERLRLLAEAGVKGTGDPAALQQRFAAGLAEIEQWMASASGDKLALSFGRAARRADSIALPQPQATEVRGSVVSSARDAAIPGLLGTERFTIRISRPGATETIAVDLAATPQPPRIDTIAAAFNQAIASVPMIDPNGQILRDAAGDPVPRFQSRFAVVRNEGGGWALELRTGGIEEVALRQQDAGAALLVTASHEASGAAAPTALSRLSFPAGVLERAPVGALTAIDREAGAVQPIPKNATEAPPVIAPLAIAAAVTDSEGFSYAVGTSRGTLGAQVSNGADDLVLVKLDSRGRQVWQRSLGTSGSASGFGVAIDPTGGVVVGGTMTMPGGDRDLLVARFGADGEERMLSAVRQLGDQDMAGLAVTADGGMVVASRNGSASDLVRLDQDGRVAERLGLDPSAGQVRALAVDGAGDLLVLTQSGEDAALRRYAGGSFAGSATIETMAGVNATSLAVSDSGIVAVGGRRAGDAAIAIFDGGQTRWATLASAGDDRIDQLLFRGSELLAGGRTTGDLGGSRSGLTDAYVARIDVASGSIAQVMQWGRVGTRSGPVAMTVAASGDSAVHRLGFNDGILNPAENQALADLTAVRPGDRFGLRVNGGSLRQIVIDGDETAAQLADRLSKLIGRAAGKVTVSRSGGSPVLRFEPAAGQRLDLLPGPDGQDALSKLGIAPGSIIVPPAFDPKAPRVTPGGHYGLDLARGLSVGDKASSRIALERVESAISTVRAGFRSLYWDDTKAALAEGGRSGTGPSPYLAGQLARYRDALARLGG